MSLVLKWGTSSADLSPIQGCQYRRALKTLSKDRNNLIQFSIRLLWSTYCGWEQSTWHTLYALQCTWYIQCAPSLVYRYLIADIECFRITVLWSVIQSLPSTWGGADNTIIMLCHHTVSVSYTHLDVYKRQVHRRV